MHTCAMCGNVERRECNGDKNAQDFFKRIIELEEENKLLREQLEHVKSYSAIFEQNSKNAAEDFEEKLKLQKEVIKLNARLATLEFLFPKENSATPAS